MIYWSLIFDYVNGKKYPYYFSKPWFSGWFLILRKLFQPYAVLPITLQMVYKGILFIVGISRMLVSTILCSENDPAWAVMRSKGTHTSWPLGDHTHSCVWDGMRPLNRTDAVTEMVVACKEATWYSQNWKNSKSFCKVIQIFIEMDPVTNMRAHKNMQTIEEVQHYEL